MRRLILLTVFGLMVNSMACASLYLPGIDDTGINETSLDSTLARAGITQSHDDLTADQDIDKVKLSKPQQHESQVWGLTELEEKRYVLLMENKSQIFYKDLRLTPIDVLGINARNEKERNKFAALSARIEAQKVAQNIAWNNAFHQAYLKEVKGLSVVGNFDPAPYSPFAYKPVALSEGDILHLFVKNSDQVSSIITPLIKAIKETRSTALNITIIDADNIGAQQWANLYHIPHILVNHNRITLNVGRLGFDGLDLKKKKTPLLLLSKNNESNLVDLGRF